MKRPNLISTNKCMRELKLKANPFNFNQDGGGGGQNAKGTSASSATFFDRTRNQWQHAYASKKSQLATQEYVIASQSSRSMIHMKGHSASVTVVSARRNSQPHKFATFVGQPIPPKPAGERNEKYHDFQVLCFTNRFGPFKRMLSHESLASHT